MNIPSKNEEKVKKEENVKHEEENELTSLKHIGSEEEKKPE